jgi:hypothetical protein
LAAERASAERLPIPHTGSLSQRMMLIAAAWIIVLLLGGGIALDRTLTGQVTRNFDAQLGLHAHRHDRLG